MNKYEAKQLSKKDYHAEKAQDLRAEAERLLERDRERMSHIPFGQPILVGHHSEKRHRRDLERSQVQWSKAHELLEKATYHERQANITSSAISSDDEDAFNKLKAKLENLE